MKRTGCKAAFHVHSDWSYDGHFSLEDIASEFSARGYDAVFISEHDLDFSDERFRAHRDACAEASNSEILLVPGIEYSDAENVVHTLVWGNTPFLGRGRDTSDLLAEASHYSALSILAHPSRRSAWRKFKPEWKSHLHAIELWNRKTDGWAPSADANRLLAASRIHSIVGHDFHTRKQLFPLAVRIALDVKLEEPCLLNAIRAGTFRCEAFGMGMEFLNAAAPKRVLYSGELLRRIAAGIFRKVRCGDISK